MLPENECVYDTIRRQWAATATSVKGKSQKISDSQYHPECAVQEEAHQGWALRKQKATGRISPAVKEYLTQVFKINQTKNDNKITIWFSEPCPCAVGKKRHLSFRGVALPTRIMIGSPIRSPTA